MALTHKLFGIRSCNEVITGERGRARASSTTSSAAWRRASPTLCSQERYGVAVGDTRLFLEGRNDELAEQLRDADAGCGRRASASRRRRSCATRCGRSQTLRERQQKMATAELGDRDVFGVKLGPSGAVVQVFQVRGGRSSSASSSSAEARLPTASRRVRRVLEAALQQFYSATGAAAGVHVPVEPEDAEALESWLSARAGRRVRIVVPQRGDKRGLVDLAQRNAELAYRARFDTEGTAQYDALEQHPGGARGCRRCRAASSASTSRPSRAARPWRRWWSARTAG